jgi:hypothetical protein
MPVKTVDIKLFKKGDKVYNDGKCYTVNHVHVQGYKLFVRFYELTDLINAESIDSEYIKLELIRKTE